MLSESCITKTKRASDSIIQELKLVLNSALKEGKEYQKRIWSYVYRTPRYRPPGGHILFY